MELILVRHAEALSLDVSDPQVADPPLSTRGQAQARRVAEWLADEAIDRIASSPARRARETAAVLAARHGLDVEIDERLRDAQAAEAPYVAIEADRARDRARYRERVAAYAERSEVRAMGERVEAALSEWASRAPGGRVVVFCHGSVANVWASAVLGLSKPAFFEARPASGHRFLVASSGARSVLSLNETAYLGAELAGVSG